MKITRRRFLCSAAVAAASTSSLTRRAAATPKPVTQPNIIFILVDDLGYGEVGCFGQKHIRTPHLDQMAREGMRLTRHFAGGPVCGPSRACLMTGQSQAIGHIKGNPGGDADRENLRPQDTTVAQLLQQAGYETACIGKWGLGPRGMTGYPTRKGFDHFVGYDTHRAAHDYYPDRLCDGDGWLSLEPDTYSHDVFTRRSLEFLAAEHDRPFFMYLAYTIPHGPHDPPDLGAYHDRDWPDAYKKYASMISRMDRDMGRLLQTLHRTGQHRNTLVIFSSDNGPHPGGQWEESAIGRFFDSNAVHRGIKRDVFNGGIIVPTIAWWPGTIEAGTTSSHVSAFQDFLPTACELAGIEPSVKTDGLSYLPALLGRSEQQAAHDRLYWEFIFMGPRKAGRQAVLDVRRNVKAVRFGRTEPVRLYDLNTDPQEADDRAAAMPDVAEDLAGYMDNCRSDSALWPTAWHDRGWRIPEQ